MVSTCGCPFLVSALPGFQGRAEIAQMLIDHGVPVDDEHRYQELHPALNVRTCAATPYDCPLPAHAAAPLQPRQIRSNLHLPARHATTLAPRDGHHPIVRACWGREKRHTETVKVMLEAGATLKGNEAQATRNPGTKKLLESWTKRKAGL